MGFDEFLGQLERGGFRVKGRSFAFREFEDWVIAFIRLGGKFHQADNVAFVICARPQEFAGMEGRPPGDSTEPHDYPLKLVLDEIREGVRYEPRLLHYEHDVIPVDSDWSDVYYTIKELLPKQLMKLAVDGLKNQIASQDELGYVEKIWLGMGADG